MDYRTLRKALRSKALAEEDRSGNHIFFYVRIRGRDEKVTKFSHSAKGQITRGLLGMIGRQMRLSSDQLQSFVDCTTSREEWVELWVKGPPEGRVADNPPSNDDVSPPPTEHTPPTRA